MRTLWDRFVASLTPGVRWLLLVWTVAFLSAFVLRFSGIRLADGLALSPPLVRSGQIWRLVTYALLPVNLPDLLMNGISLVIFGGMLERIWNQNDFLLYSLVAAAGAGAVEMALWPFHPAPLLGPGTISFGLLAATWRVCAHERVALTPSLELTMRQAAMLFAALSILLALATQSWLGVLIRISGGFVGLGYLWLRSTVARPRDGQNTVSRRINRLEL